MSFMFGVCFHKIKIAIKKKKAKVWESWKYNHICIAEKNSKTAEAIDAIPTILNNKNIATQKRPIFTATDGYIKTRQANETATAFPPLNFRKIEKE